MGGWGRAADLCILLPRAPRDVLDGLEVVTAPRPRPRSHGVGMRGEHACVCVCVCVRARARIDIGLWGGEERHPQCFFASAVRSKRFSYSASNASSAPAASAFAAASLYRSGSSPRSRLPLELLALPPVLTVPRADAPPCAPRCLVG